MSVHYHVGQKKKVCTTSIGTDKTSHAVAAGKREVEMQYLDLPPPLPPH